MTFMGRIERETDGVGRVGRGELILWKGRQGCEMEAWKSELQSFRERQTLTKLLRYIVEKRGRYQWLYIKTGVIMNWKLEFRDTDSDWEKSKNETGKLCNSKKRNYEMDELNPSGNYVSNEHITPFSLLVSPRLCLRNSGIKSRQNLQNHFTFFKVLSKVWMI